MAEDPNDNVQAVVAVGAEEDDLQNDADLGPDDLEVREFKKKRDALGHSRPLDVHRWSEHPEVNTFVDLIYNRHFLGRKREIQKRHIKVVLLDLYVNWTEDPDIKIAIARNNNFYQSGGRYNELRISRLTVDVVDTLLAADLIFSEPGFYDRASKTGRQSRIWPTDQLIEFFRDARFSVFDLSDHHNRETVVLNQNDPDDDRKWLVDYKDTDETTRMRAVLKSYNALLSQTYIDIPTLEDAMLPVRDGGIQNPILISQREKFTRRIFNRGSFECGGRFYGGWWQRCSSDLRAKIFMDDRPTNEIDFSGLHIVMLYAEMGINYWEEIGAPPYAMPVLPFLNDEKHARYVAKALMLVLLNAKSEAAAYGAFRNKAGYGSVEKRFTNDQLGQVLYILKENHRLIANQFGADAGIRLMWKDSQISEKILQRSLDWNVPILLVHDSYIVPIGYEDDLINAMYEAFDLVMGVPLRRPDNIAVKENGEREEDLEGPLLSWMPYDDLPWQVEDERRYLERIYPKKSGRYQRSYSEFLEWHKLNKRV